MAMKLKQGAPRDVWFGAKCAEFDINEHHDPWFHEEDEAIRICNGEDDGVICPIRDRCLMFALLNKENWGVWGGMYTHDRTRMRRYTPRETWGWHPATPKDSFSDIPEEEEEEWEADEWEGDVEDDDWTPVY